MLEKCREGCSKNNEQVHIFSFNSKANTHLVNTTSIGNLLIKSHQCERLKMNIRAGLCYFCQQAFLVLQFFLRRTENTHCIRRYLPVLGCLKQDPTNSVLMFLSREAILHRSCSDPHRKEKLCVLQPRTKLCLLH